MMAERVSGHRTLGGQVLCLEIDGFWSGFTYTMQRKMGELTTEIQPVGQVGGRSVGVLGSLLCGSAFHVCGIRDNTVTSMGCRCFCLRGPFLKEKHDHLDIKMNVIQTTFIIIYSFSFYSGLSSNCKINKTFYFKSIMGSRHCAL